MKLVEVMEALFCELIGDDDEGEMLDGDGVERRLKEE